MVGCSSATASDVYPTFPMVYEALTPGYHQEEAHTCRGFAAFLRQRSGSFPFSCTPPPSRPPIEVSDKSVSDLMLEKDLRQNC